VTLDLHLITLGITFHMNYFIKINDICAVAFEKISMVNQYFFRFF